MSESPFTSKIRYGLQLMGKIRLSNKEIQKDRPKKHSESSN